MENMPPTLEDVLSVERGWSKMDELTNDDGVVEVGLQADFLLEVHSCGLVEGTVLGDDGILQSPLLIFHGHPVSLECSSSLPLTLILSDKQLEDTANLINQYLADRP